MAGKLYIVATPIGNLSDITLRALETLKSVDFILCEDTRVTKKLLEHYKIGKPLISYHQHSDEKTIKNIKKLLDEDKNLALVTDAGTPGISDPGNLLIRDIVCDCHSRESGNPHCHFDCNGGISFYNRAMDSRFRGNDNIIPIPGPCAAVAALSISGFPTDKYVFMGFPPHKNKRQKFFKELKEQKYTAVFYESGHRIKKCLQELNDILEPKKQIIVCRELTKMFETVYRGTPAQVLEDMKEERGEFVVVIQS
ncbi:MAG: rRNA small subunit methyltransferase 1 [Patescibacteria group bacterium]|nr:rRNA small subunit methyltransferase 1 [Patescibacteria group bacterium]